MTKVALCVIATGKYAQFLYDLLTTAREFFCPGHEVRYFVFTDRRSEVGGQRSEPEILTSDLCSLISVVHEPWPGPTLHRYRYMLTASTELARYDYVYYIDVDSRFVRPVGSEIFGDLVATIHWGYVDKVRRAWTYDYHLKSRAYVNPTEGRRYYCGGFQGGRATVFIEAMRDMDAAIADDESRELVAWWHDESHWNRYLIDHPPTIELGPEYMSPKNYYLETQRIVIVDKKGPGGKIVTRILIGALSGWKYHERRQRCLSTWMADGYESRLSALFLLGCPSCTQPEQLGPHHLVLPCPDDYPSLPQRTLWFCRWALALENDSRADWDYLFKCDDDTYVSIPRLTAYDLEGRDYVGAEWRPGVGYGSGGAGYFLSRRVAAIVAERLMVATGAEDVEVGKVVRGAGFDFSIEPRLIAFGSMQNRPKRDNDLMTLHGVEADAFLASHAECGLSAL